METPKEKAIREAYGEHWEKLKNTVNMKTGYCVMYNSNNERVSLNFIDLGFTQTYVSENIDSGYISETNTHEWRPKSLQGIESNNGWILIESEADLPINGGDYWVINNREIKKCIFSVELNKWLCTGTISHYQQITKPNLPIY